MHMKFEMAGNIADKLYHTTTYENAVNILKHAEILRSYSIKYHISTKVLH